jgi:serine/threonine protein kinase
VVRYVVPADCIDEDVVLRLCRGELSHQELRAVDGHIDGCSECRVLISKLCASESAETALPLADTELVSGSRRTETTGAPSEIPSHPTLIPGEVLADRFVVETLVGSGGMAQVFRGHDQATGSRVAIKAIVGHSAEELARFEREARLLMSLRHPGVVGYVLHDRAPDGTPYLVMDWLEGEDLAARLRRGPLGVRETVVLGSVVAGALAATHELGIVHRDIKPSNIFLSGGLVERAVVLDYGVARPSWHQAASHATRTGTLLGTLGYMAPEQALGAKSADFRADIFSLGCVLFECLTGRRVFFGAHAVEVLAHLLTQPIEHPRALRPEIPSDVDALVVQMLAREPAARPSSCATVAAALERSLASFSADILSQTQRASRHRRRALAASLAAVVLCAASALALTRHVTPSQSARAMPSSSTATSLDSPPSKAAEVLPSVESEPVQGWSPKPIPADTATPLAPSSAVRSHEAPPKKTTLPEPDPFGTHRN